MKERPILFSGPMVKAILDGSKTMTRRVVKPQPDRFDPVFNLPINAKTASPIKCPYGVPGDRLWVRETWRVDEQLDDVAPRKFARWPVEYHAGGANLCGGFPSVINEPYPWGKWRPSIFMPRWASRMTLEVVDVKVERLQEISEDDAAAEGAICKVCKANGLGPCLCRFNFIDLWESINGKKHPWSDNPWVWVVEFRRIG